MAPLPVNNTGVLFLDYNTCQELHTIQCRYSSSGSPAAAMTFLDSFLAAIDASFRLITIAGARARAAGSNVTLPVAWTGAATYGSGAGTHNETANYFDFCGRDATGRRVRMAVFGAAVSFDSTNADYRLTTTESGTVDAGVTLLNAASTTPVTIEGIIATWYPYADIGINAYWRNRIR